MENIDWFKFEDKDLDFPFYKKNPYIPKWGWFVLFIALIMGVLLASDSIIVSIIGCLVLVVPVLYFLNWDYHAIFQKPKAKDIALAVALFIGYMIYSIAMGIILEHFGITSPGTVEQSSVNIFSIFSLVFSLMGEEFMKFIPFIFFLRVFYKYSNNRKLSVILSIIIVMIFFASLHAYNFTMFLFALCIQGFGSIFEYIGYVKTKNMWISYLTHLLTDLFVFSTMLLNF
ncbi:type II CAAX prenyl endopeptidase Rce1 family protein [uncultured Methanobrevibacter sp.]|uniref:CPBP family glutamic-type intramembrane protease n=1 Tax=uncultured Methanobrevibacter sp. TaxID=253161 RepID=UPI0025DD6BDA|nr:CPBP family glutamic-type intramembrane protease [uncultured Methanobrevibacter sp.]